MRAREHFTHSAQTRHPSPSQPAQLSYPNNSSSRSTTRHLHHTHIHPSIHLHHAIPSHNLYYGRPHPSPCVLRSTPRHAMQPNQPNESIHLTSPPSPPQLNTYIHTCTHVEADADPSLAVVDWKGMDCLKGQSL